MHEFWPFLGIFGYFWALFFIFLRAFIHQKLFSIQALYVFKRILQQKKTEGEKLAQNNFANGLAEEWVLSPGVCLTCVMYLSSQSNKNTRLQLLVRIYISFWQGQSQYPCVVNQVNVCWLYYLCFLALLPGWPSHLGYCFNSCHLWIRRPNRISWLTLDRTIFHLNICFVHLNNIFLF